MADFVIEQLMELLKALGAGMVLAAVYDFFRIIRRGVRHATAAVSGEDLLFWITAAFVVFYFFLFVDNGKFRMYMIFGLLAGGMIYCLTIGRLIVRVMGKILRKIKEILRKLLKKTANKPKIKDSYKNGLKNNKVRGGDVEKKRENKDPKAFQ